MIVFFREKKGERKERRKKKRKKKSLSQRRAASKQNGRSSPAVVIAPLRSRQSMTDPFPAANWDNKSDSIDWAWVFAGMRRNAARATPKKKSAKNPRGLLSPLSLLSSNGVEVFFFVSLPQRSRKREEQIDRRIDLVVFSDVDVYLLPRAASSWPKHRNSMGTESKERSTRGMQRTNAHEQMRQESEWARMRKKARVAPLFFSNSLSLFVARARSLFCRQILFRCQYSRLYVDFFTLFCKSEEKV